MGSKVVVGMRDLYLSRKARGNIAFTNYAGVKELEQACKLFDAVIIDSWNKLKAKQEDFERIRKENPNCILVALFQRTTGGQIRGGNMPKFDASINVEVYKGDTYQDNYAVCTKNRYTGTGPKYSIHTQKLISDGKAAN